MKLVCISDTHTLHDNIALPDGDVLLHAGDLTSNGDLREVTLFIEWFADQPHKHKIFIAGNHDFLFQTSPKLCERLLGKHPSITYLQDSGCTIDGINFWGSPWQPTFFDWAFNMSRDELQHIWNLIPPNTDVLITHGPPHGKLDLCPDYTNPTKTLNVGCEALARTINVVQPQVHIFGHIHEGYGSIADEHTMYINASTCNRRYQPIHKPLIYNINTV